ncbi:MAG TPA: hypothetical protein VGF21_19940 [Thermoleophilaceae bacterium]|jgi:hypothetical protein
MSTSWERAEAKRQAKLDDIKQQIDDGTLTVRKMTAEERAANPPKPRPERGRGRRRG